MSCCETDWNNNNTAGKAGDDAFFNLWGLFLTFQIRVNNLVHECAVARQRGKLGACVFDTYIVIDCINPRVTNS